MAAAPLRVLPAETAPRPKHLPLRVPAAPPELVPARMINEALYCERLLYLEWAQGELEDNHFTVDGRTVHRRADSAGGALPPRPGKDDEGKGKRRGKGKSVAVEEEEDEREEPPYQARSVWLSSERLGITAKIDIVEGEAGGRVVPVEYKRGRPPEIPEGAYLPERAQLCAQVLVLREHGYSCDEAAIYFAGARRRVSIAIDDALIETVLRTVARAKELVAQGEIPPPLDNSPKCNGCSLSGICLPDEVRLLQALDGGTPAAEARRGAGAPVEPGETTREEAPVEPRPAPWEKEEAAGDPGPASRGKDEAAGDPGRASRGKEAAAQGEAEIRRLHPARDDKVPLYVQDQGGRVGISGECLVVTTRDGATVEARLPNTSHVSVFGNVQVTTQAMRALCERQIPLFLFSMGGYFVGRLSAHDSNNIELRIAQHRAAADPSRCLSLARRFVAAKVRNCRTLLRRNLTEADPVRLSELEQSAKRAEVAESLESLLGIEGAAARAYFGSFSGMLSAQARALGFDLDGRNRRPPRDPVNALLSFVYALLAKEWTRAIGVAGMDPLLGFYHQPRFGRPALALDLMEEFRPIVGDSTVLSILNTGVVSPADFVRTGDAAALTPAGRKGVLHAYERRMDQLVTHPVFGYRISYRRVLEVQARLFGRFLTGEIDEYPEFRTR